MQGKLVLVIGGPLFLMVLTRILPLLLVELTFLAKQKCFKKILYVKIAYLSKRGKLHL
jgi:hypothetical protein